MKTLFITIRDGEVSKAILRSDVFRMLEGKVRMVLFVSKNKLEYFRREFGSQSVSVEVIPPPDFPRLEEYFADLFLYSLHTKSIWIKIENSYFSGGRWIARMIKRVLWMFGGLFIFRWFWRKIYAFLPDRSYDGFFRKYKPDLVFAANLISNEDARVMKAARRFGVRSVGMPKGWDNLTIKTFLSVFPDWLMVQTSLIKNDASGLLDYPEKNIKIVGFPKFDVYADSSLVMPREEFLKSMGLDPRKKTILYAGAGDQLAPYDEDILKKFLEEVALDKFSEPVQVLVRPHPKYLYRSGIIPPSKYWVLDRPGKAVGSGKQDYEFEEDDLAHLANSLAHCDILIHTASTLGVEASIFDKPVVTIAFDGKKDIPYALSVRRYYDYVHLSRMLDTGGMKVARNFAELVSFTDAYLKDPSLDRAGRKKIVEENAFRIDGKAGERIAGSILGRLHL